MPKISIIIPVYNIEKYLPECLDSILKQTFQDFEVICVNDGSTDNSLEILTSYSLKDERFKIINQENQGVSIARNVGIENAQGEYIQFVDGDDWIEPDCLELAYKKISETDADLVEFGWTNYPTSNNNTENNIDTIKKNIETKESNPLAITTVLYGVWDKIYKKDFITKNNIWFVKGIKRLEDNIFGLFCLYKNPKIEFIPVLLYQYRNIREHSATFSMNIASESINVFEVILSRDEFYNAEDKYKLITIEKFCREITYYSKSSEKSLGKKDLAKLENIVKILKNDIDEKIIKKSRYYKKLLKLVSKLKLIKFLLK